MLLKPTQGTIAVGGQDIAKLGPHNYRQMLGAVMQDDQLFAGSVFYFEHFYVGMINGDAVELGQGNAV